MFLDHNQPDKAIEVIEEGLSENPDSIIMNITLATMYLEQGDYRQAEIFMKQAERIDPDAPFVKMFSELITTSKQNAALTGPKFGRQQKQTTALSAPKFSRQQKKKR